MSDQSAVFVAVTELVEEVTDMAALNITASTRFADVDGWGSFCALRLLVAVEHRFGVHLDLREYLDIQDVGGLADALGEVAERPSTGT